MNKKIERMLTGFLSWLFVANLWQTVAQHLKTNKLRIARESTEETHNLNVCYWLALKIRVQGLVSLLFVFWLVVIYHFMVIYFILSLLPPIAFLFVCFITAHNFNMFIFIIIINIIHIKILTNQCCLLNFFV